MSTRKEDPDPETAAEGGPPKVEGTASAMRYCLLNDDYVDGSGSSFAEVLSQKIG